MPHSKFFATEKIFKLVSTRYPKLQQPFVFVDVNVNVVIVFGIVIVYSVNVYFGQTI